MAERRSRSGAPRALHAGAATRQAMFSTTIETPGPGFVEITREARACVRESGVTHGLATVFCRHTSASLAIQENADPEVTRDLVDALDRLAPRDRRWRHGSEGPDDMPAHVRAMLTGASLAVPVLDGELALGTWQGLYLVEHRDRPHRREVVLVVQGA
ncbi:secondary thiamine-phosphate synthase enzyme YjbQ [Salinarimonas rosea]|uniref:secondary thiamine-phosphate synthase enzyme YjbQ n=1 Tax=Salinarimonas rosea TaxID=552063 RepID=UPI00048CB82D|nr:secondary thiamine-phosphate synthase enzyme YjbQ [Salinarimonas rosea]